MKMNKYILICGVLITLSCANARAQDTNRIKETKQDIVSVDASVRAGIDERVAQQPQLFQKPSKSEATHSRWAFPSANQPRATRFWPAPATTPGPAAPSDSNNPAALSSLSFRPGTQIPASTVRADRATDSETTPISNADSGKLYRPPSLSGGLSFDHRHDRPNGPQLPRTALPPLSSRSRAEGLSTGVYGKQFGRTRTSPFLSSLSNTTVSSSRERAKIKQHKPDSQKYTSFGRVAPSPAWPTAKKK
jgi:hypothetical protein